MSRCVLLNQSERTNPKISRQQSTNIYPIENENSENSTPKLPVQPIRARGSSHVHSPHPHHHLQPQTLQHLLQILPTSINFELWHRRFSYATFRIAPKPGFISDKRQSRPCEACAYATQSRRPHRPIEQKPQVTSGASIRLFYVCKNVLFMDSNITSLSLTIFHHTAGST